MAHDIHVASLTEDLINHTLTGERVDDFKRLASTTFAKAQHGRTNQYDVLARMEGLEEKARILNNDPLADALHDRLYELSSKSDKWIPEVLSFLLHLSDRPVHESKLEGLERLRSNSPLAPLTWSDIFADDPLDDQDNIWKDINFESHESDDEDMFELDPEDHSENMSDLVPLDTEILEPCLESLIETFGPRELEHTMGVQHWKTKVRESLDRNLGPEDNFPRVFTESQTVREVVFMLLGLPTTIFTQNQTGKIVLSQEVDLRHTTTESVTGLLASFAEIGEKLLHIRQWSAKTSNIPMEQKFQALITLRLRDLNHMLSAVQAEMLDFRTPTVRSLLHLHQEISESSRLILQINEILTQLENVSESALSFRILEFLFDRTCVNQAVGDCSGYEYMARLFFDCFQTYLRPIRLWVEKGQLDGRDGVMFIERVEKDVPLNSLWQNQFRLVKDEFGNLYAPNCLHLTAKKILNSGKSIDFLRHLGYNIDEQSAECSSQPSLSFEDVCEPSKSRLLAPFSVLFETAFDRWIAGIHLSSSSVLHERLEVELGLQRSLEALEYIYFCRDGASSSQFTSRMFERLERGQCRWNDSFALTELIQNVYHNVSCIDHGHIEVRTILKPSRRQSSRTRQPMGVLEDVKIDYLLPWPIANIIRPATSEVYQCIFVLLMQLQRAQYLLQRRKPTKRPWAAVEGPLMLMYSVHHRLLWFTNTVRIYLTHMVLSSNTASMRSSMELADDVDRMIEIHDGYIAKLRHQCFLTKEHGPLRQAIVSLLNLTVLYSDIQIANEHLSILDSSSIVRGLGTTTQQTNTKHPNSTADAEYSGGSDLESDTAEEPPIATRASGVDKLKHIDSTFTKLCSFVTAAVSGVSKADCAPCWEMLASSLTADPR